MFDFPETAADEIFSGSRPDDAEPAFDARHQFDVCVTVAVPRAHCVAFGHEVAWASSSGTCISAPSRRPS